MCALCKHYGKSKLGEKALKSALEECESRYFQACQKRDAEMLVHLDALTQRWLFGATPKREPDVEEQWERSHR
jgi:hypothetical protein